MTTPSSARLTRTGDGPLFTLAWYAAVLVVVFTVAFWVGRSFGSETAEPTHPQAPHTPAQSHP